MVKGSPNWVRYDRSGKIVERRWYAEPMPQTDQVEAPVDQVSPPQRKVSRGIAVAQDRLI